MAHMTLVANELVFSVLSAILTLSRRLRSERGPDGPTLAGVSLLGALNRLGPQTSSQLADAERLEPQSLTRLLADLERRGLIHRERSEQDRRAVLVSLTEAGRATLEEDLGRRRAWLERTIATTLTDRERAALFEAVGPLAKLARLEIEPR